MDVLSHIGLTGLVPVVVIKNAEDAVLTAEALLAGGLDIMEITMRTEAGIQAIEFVAKACPKMLLGAGTVLTLEKCKAAVEVGAKFIVAPGFNEKIVSWCVEHNVAVTPGCVTPTEIEVAMAFGIKVLKFFPAGNYGGVGACKSLYEPYRAANISFIPTGGINIDNLQEYADKSYIHAVGGSWLCRSSVIDSHDFDSITASVRSSIDVLLGFELAHVVINDSYDDGSLSVVRRLNRAFNFPVKGSNSSNMTGTGFEAVKSPSFGDHGQFAVRTNNIERAIHYLYKRGFEVDAETAKYENDKLIAINLQDTFGGFAIQLIQR